MAGFGVTIDPADLREVELMLAGIQGSYEKVVVSSINTTLTGVKTDTKAEIRKDVTVKAAAIAKTIKVVRASKNKVSGALRSKGGFVPLINYTHSQTKKGVTVQVAKSGKRTLFLGAFIATMKSGHKGIFSREKPPWKTHRSNKLPWKRFGFTNRSYGRLPINQQFGPRIPGIMGKDSVMEPILKKAGDRIHKELGRRMNFELNKYK